MPELVAELRELRAEIDWRTSHHYALGAANDALAEIRSIYPKGTDAHRIASDALASTGSSSEFVTVSINLLRQLADHDGCDECGEHGGCAAMVTATAVLDRIDSRAMRGGK